MFLPEGAKFKVCWLYLNDGHCPVFNYLEEVHTADPIFFAAIADMITRLADPRTHCEPKVKKLKGNNLKNIFELRILGGSKNYARLPLVYTPGREVILLFGITKKSKQPPPGFTDRAIKYRNAITSKEAHYDQIDTSILYE